ncbi:MAG TPA: peptidoglycan editing factor PgeF, partial [Gammaproteobacteria bacterium]|nr:peptidoglycan editing factor PgeF [Gammaproteobacteria bacterium]
YTCIHEKKTRRAHCKRGGQLLKPLRPFTIFFGDKDHAINPAHLSEATLVAQDICSRVGARSLVFAVQEHQTGVARVTGRHKIAAPIHQLEQSADIICTNISDVGIGVFTADCMPVIIYDPVHHAASVVHAGWRGSVQAVLVEALANMQRVFSSNIADLLFYIGPCARVCCYEVQPSFVKQVCGDHLMCRSLFQRRKDRIFFDLVRFNYTKLYELGVAAHQIDASENFCTMCNPGFCSARRDRSQERQVSVIVLH